LRCHSLPLTHSRPPPPPPRRAASRVNRLDSGDSSRRGSYPRTGKDRRRRNKALIGDSGGIPESHIEVCWEAIQKADLESSKMAEQPTTTAVVNEDEDDDAKGRRMTEKKNAPPPFPAIIRERMKTEGRNLAEKNNRFHSPSPHSTSSLHSSTPPPLPLSKMRQQRAGGRASRRGISAVPGGRTRRGVWRDKDAGGPEETRESARGFAAAPPPLAVRQSREEESNDDDDDSSFSRSVPRGKKSPPPLPVSIRTSSRSRLTTRGATSPTSSSRTHRNWDQHCNTNSSEKAAVCRKKSPKNMKNFGGKHVRFGGSSVGKIGGLIKGMNLEAVIAAGPPSAKFAPSNPGTQRQRAGSASGPSMKHLTKGRPSIAGRKKKRFSLQRKKASKFTPNTTAWG